MGLTPFIDTVWSSDQNPNWYEYSIVSADFDHFKLYLDHFDNCIDWIEQNIDGWYKHVRFDVSDEKMNIRFRHERDFIIFLLRWR